MFFQDEQTVATIFINIVSIEDQNRVKIRDCRKQMLCRIDCIGTLYESQYRLID